MVHRQRMFIHVSLLSQEWSTDRECFTCIVAFTRMVHRQRVFIHVSLLSQEWSADRECLYMYRCFHKTFVI